MVEIVVHHTHLYPGARGRLSGTPGDGPALVEFSDGITVQAALAEDILALPAYRTATGTTIAAKRWRLAISDSGFRVRTRLADAPAP